MRAYTLTHLSDAVLLRDLTALVARDRSTTAVLLAHIAEVDVRRLYLPAGYPSMFVYCVEELHLSEDAAAKRLRAARAARDFPALFTALEEGRLHLTAVRLLAPHLTSENVDELIAAATHRRKAEIEALLVRRFPEYFARPGRTIFRALPGISPVPGSQQAPGPADSPALGFERAPDAEQVPGPVVVSSPESNGEQVPGPVDSFALEFGRASDVERAPDEEQVPGPAGIDPPGPPAGGPPSPERYLLHAVIEKDMHDRLRHAQALLSHSIPSGDVVKVLDRGLMALIRECEKRKFGGSSRSPGTQRERQQKTTPSRKRYVPAPVRRAVWERDQGRCTFLGERGHRCSESRFLEFDHVEPVARGGRATVEDLRLRCRAHNQYEAERAFGGDFMREKRDQARRAAVEARAQAAAREQTEHHGRTLGFRQPGPTSGRTPEDQAEVPPWAAREMRAGHAIHSVMEQSASP